MGFLFVDILLSDFGEEGGKDVTGKAGGVFHKSSIRILEFMGNGVWIGVEE